MTRELESAGREGDPDYNLGRTDLLVMDRADAAAVDGQVFHWMMVTPGAGAEAVDHLRGGASGYPTVAYVAPGEFAFRMTRKHWDRELAAELAYAETAVIVSAFDEEGWLVWTAE